MIKIIKLTFVHDCSVVGSAWPDCFDCFDGFDRFLRQAIASAGCGSACCHTQKEGEVQRQDEAKKRTCTNSSFQSA